MRAVVYKGSHEVAVEQVDDPRIEMPTDVIVRITSAAICGSDLHMYEGRTAAEPGIVFGHENMGIVEEVGEGVTRLRKGDRVVLPFNVACGFCPTCLDGNTAFCLSVNEGFAGGAYGYVAMGPYPGGQAEYLRVPFADFNALKLPEGEEHEDDFILLADVFPTGYHATELAQVSPGETVAIYGAGPVGLMAAYSAHLRGASEIYLVDKVADRLRLGEEHAGTTTIDFSESDPVEQILEHTDGKGADKGIDAVGYQAQVPEGADEVPAMVLNNLVHSVKATGRHGIVGLYLPDDPGAPTEEAKEGRLLLEIGKLFEKGQALGTGQANVKAYNRHLRDLIISGRATPSFLVSKRVSLEEAPDAYERFDKREEGYSKVVLDPAA